MFLSAQGTFFISPNPVAIYIVSGVPKGAKFLSTFVGASLFPAGVRFESFPDVLLWALLKIANEFFIAGLVFNLGLLPFLPILAIILPVLAIFHVRPIIIFVIMILVIVVGVEMIIHVVVVVFVVIFDHIEHVTEVIVIQVVENVQPLLVFVHAVSPNRVGTFRLPPRAIPQRFVAVLGFHLFSLFVVEGACMDVHVARVITERRVALFFLTFFFTSSIETVPLNLTAKTIILFCEMLTATHVHLIVPVTPVFPNESKLIISLAILFPFRTHCDLIPLPGVSKRGQARLTSGVDSAIMSIH